MAEAKRPERRRPDEVRAEEPLCPVCMRPILPEDRVTGTGDTVIHERCDHAKEPKKLTAQP